MLQLALPCRNNYRFTDGNCSTTLRSTELETPKDHRQQAQQKLWVTLQPGAMFLINFQPSLTSEAFPRPISHADGPWHPQYSVVPSTRESLKIDRCSL